MSRPLRVFLCHASQDKPAVRELYGRLKNEGWIDPWLDEEKLSFGQHWTTVIEDALHDADVVIIFLSRNSVQKEGFVQRELNYAWELSLEKPRHVIFLIPFRLDDCEIPRYLASRQWGDYFGEKKESTYQILLRSLKQRHLQKLQLEAAENVEREAVEKLAREKVEQEAKEKTEREAAAKALREKQEREAAEKLAREKAEREAKEKAEREAVEKTAREKAEQKAKEKAEREARKKADRERAEAQAREIEKRKEHELDEGEKHGREKKIREDSEAPKNTHSQNELPLPEIFQTGAISPATKEKKELPKSLLPKPVIRLLVVFGVIVVLPVCMILGSNYVSKKLFTFVTATPTLQTPVPVMSAIQTPVSSTFPPTPDIGSTTISEKDGMVLVFVPAGEFTMGSNSSNQSDERPEHTVNLDTFWIDQTEVTNAMYAKCVADGGCTPPSSTKSSTRDSYFGNSQFDDYPVIYVNWNQANAYCTWAGRRLPTEAEWEKAARGTDGRTYPWGDGISCDNANYYAGRHCVGDTSKVRSYESGKSPYGAYDMAGNVWEWVNDWYDEKYYQISPLLNPQGPISGQYRVLRGGSWSYSGDAFNIRSASRGGNDPASTLVSFGFRCSLSP